MACSLHFSLERSEGIIPCGVGLLRDLVLLHLADIIEVVHDCITTLVDHVYGEIGLRAIAAQSRFVIHHLGHSLTLLVLQLKAHVGRVGAEFPFKEVFALGDGPISIESKLREESSFHC